MVIVANATGETDGPAYEFLKRINSPIPIVLIARSNNFVFNIDLLNLDRYILADYVEMGWDWDGASHLFGKNTKEFGHIFNSDEWNEFDSFVRDRAPVLYFKRELLKKDASDYYLPIEYPNWQEAYPIQTKDEFNARLITVFNFWGRSHEERLRFHGNVWIHATKKGFSVCDNIFYLNHFLQQESGEKWVTLNIPHYARQAIGVIMSINEQSKLSVAMAGAGIKTFRHCESPVNSVMVKQRDNLAWTFEWKHGVNCIESIPGQEIAAIEDALDKLDLYEIYKNGVANAEKYRLQNYIPHIEKLINEY